VINIKNSVLVYLELLSPCHQN